MFGAPTPILRSFDEARAKAFYLDFLGFELMFEHRFEPGLPLYMGVRKGDADTLNFLNNWIEVTRSKGWIDERYAYSFGTTDWQQRVQ